MKPNIPGTLLTRRTAIVLALAGVSMTTLSSCESASKVAAKYWPIDIAGGGWVTGLSLSAGARYARTDVGGMYTWDSAARRWRQLVVLGAFGDRRTGDYQVEGLASAPSDPMTLVASVGDGSDATSGMIVRSTNGGRTWAPSLDGLFVAGNADSRWAAERIAFDPSNPAVVYVGTRRDGLLRSLDFGKTWKAVSIPKALSSVADAGVTCIAIDPSSPQIDGRHVRIWAVSGGVGLFRSEDSGLTWELARPFNSAYGRDFAVSESGILFICLHSDTDSGENVVLRDSDGVLSDITPPGGFAIVSLSISGSRLVAVASTINAQAGLLVCDDASASTPVWQPRAYKRTAGGQSGARWTSAADLDELFPGQIRWEGAHLILAEGMGIWRFDFETSAMSFYSRGIEELVANALIKPMGSALVTASWDRGLVSISVTGPAETSSAFLPYRGEFGAAWDLDVSRSDPKFLVAILDDSQDTSGTADAQRRASGYSMDSGRSWTRFDALASGRAPSDMLFGNIAVSTGDVDNLVWVPSNQRPGHPTIYFSRDRGVSWAAADISGDMDALSLHENYTYARKCLLPDVVVKNRFYLLASSWETGSAISLTSVDGGQTWRQIGDFRPPGENFRHDAQLRQGGDAFFITCGSDSARLWKSSDLRHWSAVESISRVRRIAVAAQVNDRRRELFALTGKDGSPAYQRSTNGGVSFDKLIDAAMPFQSVRALEADPEVNGRAYIGFAGTGYAAIQF